MKAYPLPNRTDIAPLKEHITRARELPQQRYQGSRVTTTLKKAKVDCHCAEFATACVTAHIFRDYVRRPYIRSLRHGSFHRVTLTRNVNTVLCASERAHVDVSVEKRISV